MSIDCGKRETQNKTRPGRNLSSKSQSLPSPESNEAQITKSNLLVHEFYSARAFPLNDTIYADFDGDGTQEYAFFLKEGNSSGIIIRNQPLKEGIRIGFGNKF